MNQGRESESGKSHNATEWSNPSETLNKVSDTTDANISPQDDVKIKVEIELKEEENGLVYQPDFYGHLRLVSLNQVVTDESNANKLSDIREWHCVQQPLCASEMNGNTIVPSDENSNFGGECVYRQLNNVYDISNETDELGISNFQNSALAAPEIYDSSYTESSMQTEVPVFDQSIKTEKKMDKKRIWSEGLKADLEMPIECYSSDEEQEDILEKEQIDDSDDEPEETYDNEKEDINLEEERVFQAIKLSKNIEKLKRKLKTPGEAQQKKRRTEENKEIPYKLIKIDGPTVLGKDGKTVWYTSPIKHPNRKLPPENLLDASRRMQNGADFSTQPLECFVQFFTEEIFTKILKSTNAKINMKKLSYKNENSTLRSLCKEELLACFGVMMFGGLMKNNHLSIERLFDPKLCGDRYRAAFSRSRLSFLISALRFDDSKTREARKTQTKLAAISEIWDIFVTNCKNSYEPNSHLTIDAQLVSFKGKCPFKMYLPNKPNKFGIKIVMCCDESTKYMWNAMPYLGKGTTPPNIPVADYFVENLISDLKGSNRNITTNDWFMNFKLAQKLLDSGLAMLGTIKKNKSELPPEFVDIKYKNRPNDSSIFIFNSKVSAVSYKPKQSKLVILLSTLHNDDTINEITSKPEIFLQYNSTKGAVDSFDRLCQSINCGRTTKRWPMAFFYNMLNIAVNNSYVVYLHNFFKLSKNNTTTPMRRFEFILKLVDQTLEPWLRIRLTQSLPHVTQSLIKNCLGMPEEESLSIVTVNSPGSRKYCSFCSYKRKRLSKMVCENCRKSVCGEHHKKVCVTCYGRKF